MPADPIPPSPGPQVPDGPTSMLALGAALGADVWWLEQVFAVTGGWVPSTEEAAVRVHLAEVSRVAGDHAAALRAHLPRPASVDPGGWVLAPFADAPSLVADVAARTAAVERLAVLHRVLLTRLVVAWARPLGPSARGPVRAIGHARTDLAALRDEGEDLLEVLLGAAPPAVDAAHAATRAVEVLLVAGGGHRPTGSPAMPT